MIEREAIAVPWHEEEEQHEGEPRNDMLVQRVERLIEKMSERDDGQYESERDQRVACFQSEDDQSAGDELDERNGEADRPQRPRRQKRVLKRQKESLHVTGRPEAEHFPDAGHEEDEAKDEPREKNGPTLCGGIAHRKMKN